MSAVDVVPEERARVSLPECLRLAANLYRTHGYPEAAEEVLEARAAVSELIAADKEYDAALAAVEAHHRAVDNHGYADAAFFLTRKLAERLVRARMARDTALARVGGAA